jgi:hypothetical protein
MANGERQMPGHVEAAYRGAVDNILFLKKQQWLATNYVLLLYVAVFLISAHYFSRTDVARNWLGGITIAAFVIHWWMLHFQRRRARGIGSAAGTKVILVSTRGLPWAHSRFIGRSGVDRGVFVVGPLTLTTRRYGKATGAYSFFRV